MALFSWPEPTTCGEVAPDPCTALDDLTELKALRGTDPDSLCEVELTSEQHPAYPVILGDNSTQARSGSAAFPLPLDLVQSYTGQTVPSLAFRNAGGDLAIWDCPEECDNHRVVVQDGDFTIIPDINSNVFEESCIGTIDDIQYIAGGTTFTDCNGVTRLRLVFFPKAEICTYCGIEPGDLEGDFLMMESS